MKSLFKITIWISFILLLAMFAAGQSGMTTYTQTTHGCTLTACSDAQFTPTATLSYSAEFSTCGEKDADLIVNWNGTVYTDGKADMNFIGTHYLGHNYYPWAVWETRGTFNGGTVTLVEHVLAVGYHGCAGNFNLDGSVTAPIQPSTDILVPGGTGGGGQSAHCAGTCGSKP